MQTPTESLIQPGLGFTRPIATKPVANKGFSLVEVTLALGIVALAIVPLLALLPMGLSAQRQAIEDTTVAQIQQSIVGDLQRSEFQELIVAAEGDPQLRYYDEQGNQVDVDDDGVGSGGRLYDAEITVIYPGTLAGVDNFNLVRADIRLKFNPGGGLSDPFSAENRADTIKRSALIAKTSK